MISIKFLNLSFFLLIVEICISQQVDKNQHLHKIINRDGLKFELWVEEDDKKTINFHQDKFYFWYKSQIVMQTQGSASGQLLHGNYEVFYANKQLAEKGRFRKGLKQGEWLYWREDGTLIRSEHWSKGLLVGTLQLFNEKGELVEEKKIKRFSFEKKEVSAKEKTPSPFWLKVKGLFHKKEKSSSKNSKNAA